MVFDIDDANAVEHYRQSNLTRAEMLLQSAKGESLSTTLTFAKPLSAREVKTLLNETGVKLEFERSYMRTIAGLLFEFGRLQHILTVLFIVHLLLFIYWRHDLLRRGLIASWSVVFLLCSAIVFWITGLFGQIMDGVGYSYAHLYGGMWTDQEALNTMLSRWRNLLLPIYVPWLLVWVLGVLSIANAPAKWEWLLNR